MLKFILLSLVSLFLQVNLSGQNIGLRAGVNLAKYTGDVPDNGSIVGFQLGAIAEFGIVGPLKLDLNLLYTMKGSYNEVVNLNVRNNYLDLPVLLHVDIAWIYLEAGPSFSYLLSAASGNSNLKDAYKSVETGAILGVGFNLDIARIDLRYNTSLSKINELPTDQSIKNSVITFGIGLMLW